MEETSQPSASFSDLLVNVFSSPSEAFDALRNAPSRTGVWLLPYILTLFLGAAFTYVLFTNDTLREEALEPQRRAMEERVASGQMTQEQADAATAQMEGMGEMMMVFGLIGVVIFVSLAYFCGALVLWLAGKLALKSTAGYGKYLELYGLSNWIGILGMIVTILMVVGMNSIYASPSLALAILDSYDVGSTMHRLFSSLNIFAAWQAIVIGIGLSKLAEKPAGAGMTVALILWAIWIAISVALGFAR
jgi:hypothetical protein